MGLQPRWFNHRRERRWVRLEGTRKCHRGTFALRFWMEGVIRIFFSGALIIAILASSRISVSAASVSRLSEMDYLVGSWSCKFTKAPQPKWLGTTLRINTASHGRYISLVYPGSGVARLVYNPRLQQFVYIETDDDGTYGASTSPGWVAGTSTWKSILASTAGAADVVTITKKGSSTYLFDVTKPSQTAPYLEQLCSKV